MKKEQEKRQKQVIIIANENIHPFKPFIKKCENNHKETLFEFIYVTGVSVPNILTASSQELACDLGEQGFCVMLYSNINNQENLTIYFPQQLSLQQKQYIEERIENIKKFTLSIYFLDNQNVLNQYPKEKSNIEGLIKLINEKQNYLEKNNHKSKTKVLQSNKKITNKQY